MNLSGDESMGWGFQHKRAVHNEGGIPSMTLSQNADLWKVLCLCISQTFSDLLHKKKNVMCLFSYMDYTQDTDYINLL